jgi:DNA modification methylase
MRTTTPTKRPRLASVGGRNSNFVPDLTHDDPALTFIGIVADRIELRPVATIKVGRAAARTHDEAQIALIMGSFTAFGLINPIIVDEQGQVLAGVARLEAARRLGIKTVPTVPIVHLSDDEKRAYRLADNRIAELAGWDTKLLAIEFEHLLEINYDVTVIGFSTPQIDIVLAGDGSNGAEELEEPVDIDDTKPAISRVGDLFGLGRHLVLCGDALSPGSYARLLGSDQARMALSDPPYNCAIDGFVGGLGKVKHREFAMAAGEMSDQQFQTFLKTYFGNVSRHLVDGALIYTFMDWRQQLPLLAAAKASELRQINLCVWNKLTGGMGSFYRSQHELCTVHRYGDAPHLNLVELGRNGRYRTNVWDQQGMAGFSRDRDELLKAHPTVKPWAMLAEAIKDCTHHGDLVLDAFLGSGSTLIAAEKCGRVCRGIELDPLYVDTIVRRWEKLTGKSATHLATGLTLDQLALSRTNVAAETNVDGGSHA